MKPRTLDFHPGPRLSRRRTRGFQCILLLSLGFICLGAVNLRFAAVLRQTLTSSTLDLSLRSSTAHGSCKQRLDRAGLSLEGDGDNLILPLHGSSAQRRRMYLSMNESIAGGLHLEAENTQGLGVSDIFRNVGGKLEPILVPLDVPVRAVVAPVTNTKIAKQLLAGVQRHLTPLFPRGGIWMQDPDMLHATLFHASTHMDPMPASTAGINEEVLSLIQTASNTCPMQAILERVVITRSGTVVACWQVLPGSIDPSELRRRLKLALPDASRKQVVTDHAILHTTLARIGVPLEGDWSPTESAHALWMATGAMTADLCGLTTTFDLLWYVEEADRLALALNGRLQRRSIPLLCEPKL